MKTGTDADADRRWYTSHPASFQKGSAAAGGAARATLGATAFDSAWVQGGAMSREAAIEMALEAERAP